MSTATVLEFVGFSSMLLFFSAVCGCGLYLGAFFASRAWPLVINVQSNNEGGGK